jgi:hypothetical protein
MNPSDNMMALDRLRKLKKKPQPKKKEVKK